MASAIAFIYLVFSISIPFFSDMSYISSVAHNIYETNLHNLIDFKNDNGTPPLYSLYFSIIWKLFGYKLWVSHLAVFPFFIGFIYQFYRFSQKYLTTKATFIALLFIIIDPTFMTQFILMGYDIILVFLFFLSINAISKNNYKLLIMSTIIIPLINIRGFSIVISIFFIQLFFLKNGNLKSIVATLKYYIPAIIVTITWFTFHYFQTSWIVVSNQNTSLHHISSLTWIFKNFIFEIIAFNSNGRLVIIAGLLLFYFFKNKNKRVINRIPRELIILIMLSLAPFIIIFTPLHYPVGPRYFMIAYPFIYLSFVYNIQKIKIKYQKLIITLSVSIIVLSNFWVNPYPYSNSWDSSLKSISYLKIQKQMLVDFKDVKLSGESIIVDFPLHKNMKYNYLDNNYNFQFSIKSIEQAPKGSYIIYSNVYNNLELRNEKPSIDNLNLYKEYHCYPAWIKVYRKE